ncbi:hypothetical protein JCM14469_27000 [Desulfatiferula olefinivorans]
MTREKKHQGDGMTDMPSDPFDRSYALDELMPVTHVEPLLRDLIDLGVVYVGIIRRDGSVYCSTGSRQRLRTPLEEPLPENPDDGPIRVRDTVLVMPLCHQFDCLAFLWMEFSPEDDNRDKWEPAIRFIARMLLQTIATNYRNLMTSGLHSQVVRESYEEISHKNELLEKSERKYRQLAENLEKEVLRKSEEIREAHTQLMHQEKLASIGHLAAGVAHEINNPMGFISSNLRMLKEYTRDLCRAFTIYDELCGQFHRLGVNMEPSFMHQVEEGKDQIRRLDIDYLLDDIPKLLDESLEGADRINKIVSDLKDFAHPGDDKPTSADLIECIESTIRIVWNELKYKARVIRHFQALPRITCFPRQLNQVIMNLLVNAAQAIDTNGEIEIRTRDLGDRVELSVRDNGHGIPADIRDRIFDPFFTTKEAGKGTGLGLNLVYNIVKKHHGRIRVESTVGTGTTFVVTLPVNPDL